MRSRIFRKNWKQQTRRFRISRLRAPTEIDERSPGLFSVARSLVGEHMSRVGVVHVPKCGGTTLKNLLSNFKNTYTDEKYFEKSLLNRRHKPSMPDGELVRFANLNQLRPLYQSNSIIIGHFSAQCLRKAGAEIVVATVREPRSRLISLYRYWQSLDRIGDLQRQGLRGLQISSSLHSGFESFLTNFNVFQDTDNQITRFLSGPLTTRGGLWATLGHHGSFEYRPIAGRWQKAVLANVDRVFWASETDHLLTYVASKVVQPSSTDSTNLHLNRTPVTGEIEYLRPSVVEELNARTRFDSEVLKLLMEENRLSFRNQHELDQEFAHEALKHGLIFN